MEDLEEISFTGVRGIEGVKEATVTLGDREVKIAVVNGLKCADEVLNKMKAGEVYYDFVEVMACKRGCITGGVNRRPSDPEQRRHVLRECIISIKRHRLSFPMKILLSEHSTMVF